MKKRGKEGRAGAGGDGREGERRQKRKQRCFVILHVCVCVCLGEYVLRCVCVFVRACIAVPSNFLLSLMSLSSTSLPPGPPSPPPAINRSGRRRGRLSLHGISSNGFQERIVQVICFLLYDFHHGPLRPQPRPVISRLLYAPSFPWYSSLIHAFCLFFVCQTHYFFLIVS